jgi:predicted ATPase/DNA-binding SARP family transcriptional activator
VHLLGGFRVTVGDARVADSAWQRRPAAIVKLLALEPSHRLHREHVMERLWPDLDLDAQANNLNVVLHAARNALISAGAPRGAFLTRDRDMLVLGQPEALWVDVSAFETGVAAAWRASDPVPCRAALDLYSGDLLPEDPYEEWLEGRRTALRTSYLALLTRLGQLLAERNDAAGAIEAFQRVLAAEPAQEDAHVALMRLYGLAGQRSQALAQFDQLVAVLERELDAEPEHSTRDLAGAIRAGRYPASAQPLVPEVLPPAPPTQPIPTNLPAFVSDLVGREQEVAEVKQLLSTARLVTLTGPGGIGKTRLGVAVAGDVAETFPDGVVFVDLAPIQDTSFVVPAIAQALGVREIAEQPLDVRLKDFLRERRMLLVLDNFEQVAEAAPVVASLLEAAPYVKALVTSRLRLRLRGEHEYPVPTLAVPGVDDLPIESMLAQYAALVLFIRRAREVQPGFGVTIENAPAVVAICSRLDGLPLAIELAAAHSKVLDPPALLARLDRPLALLSGGARDLPARQQTMRNTIQWSYDLLDLNEQALFRHLSAFVGGWTLEAADAVAGSDRDGEGAVLDGLASLVDKSLVTRHGQPDRTMRFDMLETIREFGLERLEQHAELAPVQRRHTTYYLGLAERLGWQWVEDAHADIVALRRQFELELDNLRAALGWVEECGAQEPEVLETTLRMSGTIVHLWRRFGLPTEGRRWIESALAQRAPVSAAARATALNAAGFLATDQGDVVRAEAFLIESLALAGELGNAELLSTALSHLGRLAAWQGNTAQAQELLEQALRLARPLGKTLLTVNVLDSLGGVAMVVGDYAQAIARFEEGLEIAQQHSSSYPGMTILNDLGRAWLLHGDPARALPYLTESLRLNHALGPSRAVADCLEDIACVAVSQAQAERAARLLAAAERLREVLATPRRAVEIPRYADLLERGREQLPEPARRSVWADGRALSLDEAVAYALTLEP